MKERIKLLRESLNLSKGKFGAAIGISTTAVTSIENGKNNVSDRTVRAICLAFGVREEWLRDGTGRMMERDAVADDDLFSWAGEVLAEGDPFKLRLLAVLRKLSPEQWDVLEDVASMLAEEEEESGRQ